MDFGNSEGKSMSLLSEAKSRSQRLYGMGLYLIDSAGKKFGAQRLQRKFSYTCPEDEDLLLVRIVAIIGVARGDKYGETKNTRQMFLVSDFFMQKEYLSNTLDPEF